MGISDQEARIFTVGHSNISISDFISLLHDNQIEVLVDVRSHPYSKNAPQFNKGDLETALKKAGINYMFMGSELGGLPTNKEFYDSQGYVLYSRIAISDMFLEAITRLEKGVKQYRIALMCSEEDPQNCHRRLLIGKVLQRRGIEILHLRMRGEIQSEEFLRQQEKLKEIRMAQKRLWEDGEDGEWKSTRSALPKRAPNHSLKN